MSYINVSEIQGISETQKLCFCFRCLWLGGAALSSSFGGSRLTSPVSARETASSWLSSESARLPEAVISPGGYYPLQMGLV